ncbi:MAG: histidine kinase [Saprospiraceae bacterium]
MKTYTAFFIILFCSLSPNHLVAEELRYSTSEWEYTAAEKEDWSKELPTKMGRYRIRVSFNIESIRPIDQHYSLYISLLASSEVYWDGILLGKNGQVGDSQANEVAGRLETNFLIPDTLLTKGKHLVELEISNFYAKDKIRFYGVWLGDHQSPLQDAIRQAAFMHIYAGCFLIIGLFYGARYLANLRKLPELAFSVLCLAFFLLIILEYVRNYYHYTYDWHFVRLQFILGISWVIGLMLPLFFVWRFSLPSYRRVIVYMLIGFTAYLYFAQFGYDLSTNLTMVSSFFTATYFCLQAYQQRKKGSLLALIGVAPVTFALIAGYKYYDIVLYIGFAHLVLMMLISLALQEKENTRLREAALLHSSRLEIELLKKNIQPHFLMNSITSALAWIEQSPKKGVELLLALSQEFEILLDISSKKLIPIQQEIELCQAHLKIMGFRKEQHYQLQTSGFSPTATIPPAIFLTVIENGISHQNSADQPVQFVFSAQQKRHSMTYQLLSRGKTNHHAKNMEYGTGLKYIEARLKESYPNCWKLSSKAHLEGWLTEVIIFKK